MGKKEIRIVLAGLGGYGRSYLNRLLDPPAGENFRMVGLIEPQLKPSETLDRARAHGWPFYKDLPDFFAADQADLVILATPIHLHAPQTIQALEQGANVLCEKPLAATVQEALAMRAAEKASGKFVAVGYQASFSSAVQDLKQDILQGVYGRPLRMKTLYLWPRTWRYYHRGRWAGAKQLDNGTWVLDSPANNATAHFLHNMFYLLGDTVDTSARLTEVQAETYRANDITNYDTAALRCRTDREVEIMFFTTHAVPTRVGPICYYEFEKGCVYCALGVQADFQGRLSDGTLKNYGSSLADNDVKIWSTFDSVRTGERPPCGIEATMAHTLCINGVQDAMPDPVVFSPELVEHCGEGEEKVTCAQPLAAAFTACYDQWMLPSEYGGIPWTRAGRRIDLRDYRHFPGGRA